MMKVLGWIFLVVVVVVAGFIWWGYRAVTASGDTASVNVAIPAERAWTLISVPESLAMYADRNTTITSSGTGALAIGDTLRIRTVSPTGSEDGYTWIVSAVEAPRRITFTTMGTDLRLEREAAIIPGTGDSLAITSRITFAATNDTTKVPGGTLMIGAIRLMEQARLDLLKARLEGRPAPGAPATP